MIITPYSALDTQDELAATAANFPALKHFFPCTESASLRTLTDIVGGVVIPLSTCTVPATNALLPATASSDVALTSGHWTAPGTTATVVFAVGRFGVGSSIKAGFATSGVLNLSGQITASVVEDADTAINATALTGGAEYGIGMKVEFGGNVTSFEAKADGTAAYTEKAGVALTGLPSILSMADSAGLTTLTSLYGWAIFQFTDGIPADIGSAVTWMTQNWKAGKKGIYPGWKGLS